LIETCGHLGGSVLREIFAEPGIGFH
jgi:hypothetical protein